MEMRNVHEFDGKVPMKLNMLYGEDQMKQIINDAGFLNKMKYDARFMANQIITENDKKNIDPLNNNMDARQLFVRLLEKISMIQDQDDKETFHMLLEEQLSDMKNLGSCPQGRSIRLWQLLHCIDNNDK